jgi:FMN-dependent NADH-azoreductase
MDEFLAADRYVFSVPLSNFSLPAGFKAYVDQIVRVGRTFSVAADGSYKGLVTSKKLLLITARGGSYPKDTPY